MALDQQEFGLGRENGTTINPIPNATAVHAINDSNVAIATTRPAFALAASNRSTEPLKAQAIGRPKNRRSSHRSGSAARKRP
jgi:hypothetical protein